MLVSRPVILASTLLLQLGAQQYSFQPFIVQASRTYAQAINNRGDVVGYFSPRNSGNQAFKRDAEGVFELVTIPEFYDNIALTGINNFGDLAGYASTSEHGISIEWGFTLTGSSHDIYTKVNYADFDSDPFYRVRVNGLNSSVNFVGYSSSYRGFVNIGGVFSAIQFAGNQFTTPHAIAWDGTVVGCYSEVGTGVVGFLRGPHGNYLGLKIANAQYVCALGISNPAGKIVGSFQDTNGKSHGFIYNYLTDLAPAANGGTLTIPVHVIDYPDAAATVVTGIDGKDLITGWTTLPNGKIFSFVGTPQPLP